MRLPNFKRIITNDFEPEFKDLISQIALSFNNDMENLYLALSKRLTLDENIQCTVKVIEMRLNSDGTPTEKLIFKLDQNSKESRVIGCDVLKVENLSSTTVYPTSAPFITFEQDGELVTIKHITGLSTGYVYLVTIVAYN